MTAHNKQENFAIRQQGGVGTIVMGEVLTYYKQGARDFRKLGRWTSFILQSVRGHRTRIVQAYAVSAVHGALFTSSMYVTFSLTVLGTYLQEICLRQTYFGNFRCGEHWEIGSFWSWTLIITS